MGCASGSPAGSGEAHLAPQPRYLAAAAPLTALIRIRQGQGGGKGRSWLHSSGAPGAWYYFRGRRQGPSCPSLRTASPIPGLGGRGGGRGADASRLLNARDRGPEMPTGAGTARPLGGSPSPRFLRGEAGGRHTRQRRRRVSNAQLTRRYPAGD